MNLDPAIASERAGRLIDKINENLGPGWPQRFLTHPGHSHLAIREDNTVALFCPGDGVLHLRPSDGQLIFTRVVGATWMVFEVGPGGKFSAGAIGPVADPGLQ
jgi:hypothetical protein